MHERKASIVTCANLPASKVVNRSHKKNLTNQVVLIRNRLLLKWKYNVTLTSIITEFSATILILNISIHLLNFSLKKNKTDRRY